MTTLLCLPDATIGPAADDDKAPSNRRDTNARYPVRSVPVDAQILSLRLHEFFGRNRSSLACLLFVLTVLAAALAGRSLPLAIYLLSFGHYALYWIAFAFGTIAFDVFKRDAIAMKTLSVAALAFVYLRAPLDPASLAVIAGGILLNLRAAQVLGLDRTYYGHEVAGLPARRVTAFPYSLTSHPMILGNIAAFGGTLINPAFRAGWWPLASLHVVLNVGLLAMELAGPRRRRAVQIGGSFVLAGVLLGAVLAIARGIP